MAQNGNVWQKVVYVILGIILIAVALRVIGLILNLAVHLVGIFFSLLFVVALIYVIYIIFRGAFTGR